MLANHLWQSTVFAVLAGVLALALRKNRADVRYWIWMAASLKFLLPFALLSGIGGQLPAPARTVVPASATYIAHLVEDAGQPFTVVPPTGADHRPSILFVIWMCGFLAVLATWVRQWRRVRSSPRLEPGVFGIFRPKLILPEGIADRLTPAQLEAVIAHELCHIRRRDNLFAAIHMVVEAIFWFHPLVWWIGARLLDERERACDEEVLRRGSDPAVYAEGILTACRLYLESPLACVSGVTGADLKTRIQRIMTDVVAQPLTRTRKLLLAVCGAAVIAGPIVGGFAKRRHMGSRRSRARRCISRSLP
jgi:bla regulator protein BlaR1